MHALLLQMLLVFSLSAPRNIAPQHAPGLIRPTLAAPDCANTDCSCVWEGAGRTRHIVCDGWKY